MKKIVVPCDFSEPSLEAVKFAIDLATQSGGSVAVVKVIDLPILAYGASIDMPIYNFSPNLLKELEEEAKSSRTTLGFCLEQRVHVEQERDDLLLAPAQIGAFVAENHPCEREGLAVPLGTSVEAQRRPLRITDRCGGHVRELGEHGLRLLEQIGRGRTRR